MCHITPSKKKLLTTRLIKDIIGHERLKIDNHIKSGADMYESYMGYDNAMHAAITSRNDYAVKILINNGFPVDHIGFSGYSPLMIAAKMHHTTQVMQMLIDSGADVEKVNRYGLNAINIAKAEAEYGSYEYTKQYEFLVYVKVEEETDRLSPLIQQDDQSSDSYTSSLCF